MGNSDEAATILPKIAAGDENANNALLDRYGGLVWSLARKLCETEADAEDSVQDIFLDVWKSAGRYDPSVASETTFIAMIARRRLIDRRRRLGRMPKREGFIEETVRADSDDQEQQAGAISEEAAAANSAMAELSEEQRRVLRLSIVHGLSHDKISSATGLPLGTVKTHARRGLIKVRKVLAERHGLTGDTNQSSTSDHTSQQHQHEEVQP